MKPIFVDTSGFVALRNLADTNHALALGVERLVASDRLRLLTSNFVLDETYTWIRMTLGHAQAVAFGAAVQQSRILDVVQITPDVEQSAWDIFVRFSDKTFSYTDCTSFALMTSLNLDTAFAFDAHFRQYGLKVMP